MAGKTITLDLEAYEALSRHRAPEQSFSVIIKEHFGGGKAGRDLETMLATIQLADDTLNAIEQQIAARRHDLARAPEL